MGEKSTVRHILNAIHWRRTLRRSTLSLNNLDGPLRQPSERDFIIAGCPRSGTSLLAAVLFSPPDVAVSMEPWDGLRLPPADLFESLRAEIRDTGSLGRGRLDVDALEKDRRVVWARDGEVKTRLEMGPDYALGVKWPTYWQLLPHLPDTKFLITVRHPVEVLASFDKVGGRLGEGLDYDVAFNATMNHSLRNATDDRHVRQAMMYQYIYERTAPFMNAPNVLTVRYEDWFNDRDRLADRIRAFLGLAEWRAEVDIRRPSSGSDVERFRSAASEHCPIAEELGYEV